MTVVKQKATLINGWIEELVNKRISQKTNVYVVQTFDTARIGQLMNLMTSQKLDELLKVNFEKRLCYNLQLEEVTGAGKQAVSIDPTMPTTTQLLTMMRKSATIVLIHYVFTARHAEVLNDFLAAISYDPDAIKIRSTVIVFATDEELFPTALRRALLHTVHVVPSTSDERRSMLDQIADEMTIKYNIPKLDVTEDIVQASSGLTLREVNTAALESYFKYRKFDVKSFTEYKIAILANYEMQYIEASRGFDSVGGYEYLKDYVRNRIIKILRNPEIAHKYGLTIPKGILLYGPPGTGKTWFASCLSKEVGLPMITISPSDFLRGIVGETEARIRELTRLIDSMSPIIVFIDEFDQLTIERGQQLSTDSGVTRRMQSELLKWVGSERSGVFLVGATNFVDQIDKAFLRPGRIDEIVPMFLPDRTARVEILKVHTSKVRQIPLDHKVALGDLADATHLWTGAELEKLVLEASSIAMEQNLPTVNMSCFIESMKSRQLDKQQREKSMTDIVGKLRKLDVVNQRFLEKAIQALSHEDETMSKIVRV